MKFSFYFDKRLRKLFYRNLFVFSLMIITPTVMMIFSFAYNVRSNYHNKVEYINESTTQRLMSVCDNILKEIELYAVSVSESKEVASYIASSGNESYEEDVKKHLSNFRNVSSYISSIYLYNDNTKTLLSDESLSLSEDAINKLIEGAVSSRSPKTRMKIYARNNKYPFIIQMTRLIQHGTHTGKLIVEIDVDRLGMLFQTLEIPQPNLFFIVDNDGKIVYGNPLKEHFNHHISEFIQQGNSKATIDNKNYMLAQKTSMRYPICYISLMPVNDGNIAESYGLLVFSSAIIFFIISLVVSIIITRKSISPIGALISAIDHTDGDIGIQNIPVEIKLIIKDILKSIDKSSKSEEEINIRVMLLKLAHAQALSAQINPHFLYNTLDSLNWMAFEHMGKENKLSESLETLSQMYRLGLQTDSYVVPFEEELRHAQLYSDIMKVRYYDKLSINFDISKETLGLFCVKFILQPMIENAVYHGIKPKRSGGNVTVTSKQNDGKFYIFVSDDGIGIKKEKLLQLNKELKKPMDDFDEQIRNYILDWNEFAYDKSEISTKSWWLHRKRVDTGLGIKNVNNRIKLIFGTNYGVSLLENETGGITAKIVLPYIDNI